MLNVCSQPGRRFKVTRHAGNRRSFWRFRGAVTVDVVDNCGVTCAGPLDEYLLVVALRDGGEAPARRLRTSL